MNDTSLVHVVEMSTKVKHKSGAFKQNNKTHKNGRHRTKGELNDDHKGVVLCS